MARTGENQRLERGAVVISLDTEQIWGYLDFLREAAFETSFPRARQISHDLLGLASDHSISATWCVVGALSLSGSQGASSQRMSGLPAAWIRPVPAGDEETAPLWYARSFVERLRDNPVHQEIGLHGGLTHLLWARPEPTRETLRAELVAGVKALGELGIRPTAFTYPRNFESNHSLLREAGIRCYRGPGPHIAARLRNPFARYAARLLDEWRRATPPTVYPEQRLPGLWSIPGSMLPFRMDKRGVRLAPIETRLERARRGVEAAARSGRVFHLWLHPENLAESAEAVEAFDRILSVIDSYRQAGDVEVLTMTQICDRIEGTAATENCGKDRESKVARVS